MTHRFSNRVTGCVLTAAALLALTQVWSFSSDQLGQSPKMYRAEPQLKPIWRVGRSWWQWNIKWKS